jgi:hypothetical protein
MRSERPPTGSQRSTSAFASLRARRATRTVDRMHTRRATARPMGKDTPVPRLLQKRPRPLPRRPLASLPSARAFSARVPSTSTDEQHRPHGPRCASCSPGSPCCTWGSIPDGPWRGGGRGRSWASRIDPYVQHADQLLGWRPGAVRGASPAAAPERRAARQSAARDVSSALVAQAGHPPGGSRGGPDPHSELGGQFRTLSSIPGPPPPPTVRSGYRNATWGSVWDASRPRAPCAHFLLPPLLA